MDEMTLHVLMVEDNPADVDLVRGLLHGPVAFELEAVSLLSDALARVRGNNVDLVLLDMRLPDSEGLGTFLRMKEAAPDLPVVLLTGTLDHEMAMAALNAGAQDFIVKEQAEGGLLVRAILNAVERKRAEAALRASEVRYRRLFEAAKDGILILDIDTGVVVDVNPFLTELLGVPREGLVGKSLWDLAFLKDVAANQDAFAELQRREYVRYDHLPLETADRRKIDVEFVSNVYAVGARKVIQCNIREITARKLAERRERLLRDLLDRLNHPESTTDTIRDIMQMIRTSTGLDAVGIRLREGDDFPYRGTDGLPGSAAEAERALCSSEEDGSLAPDAKGAPVPECMCGRVLSGRTDPTLPYFTEAGSFWTNCTTDLLADSAATGQQAPKLDRCARQGYESIALVPLRVDKDIIGLLQFNDRKRDRFTPEVIRFFEVLGSSIGIALCRKRQEDERASALQRLEELSQLRQSLLTTEPLAQKLKRVTDTIVRVFQADFCGIWLTRPGDLCEQGCPHAPVPGGARMCRRQDRCLHLLASSGQPPAPDGKSQRRVPFGHYEVGRVAAGSARKFLTHDAHHEPRMQGSDLPPGPGLVSFAGYRFKGGGEDEPGVLALFARHPISPSEDASLDGLGSTIAFLIGQAAAQDALADSETRYRTLFETSADGILITDGATRKFKYANAALCSMLGYTERELRSMGVADIHPPDVVPVVVAAIEAGLRGEPHPAVDIPCLRKDGSVVYANVIGALTPIDEVPCSVGFFRDVTGRKLAEADRDRLEAQLRQAQKMEAIGQLAGGVAHDFNNLLTGISGFTQFALDATPDGSSACADLAEVLVQSKRAATLTRQLLAFSRRQPLEPEVLNINRTVSEMTNMLRRLIGENIDLVFAPDADLGNVNVDPGQLEQVLMNLAVNARDAISDGGKVTVETANVSLDEDYASTHPDVSPGEYVMMAVSDTGCGMDANTREHAFEPFFTTKAPGKGTGLGLSTVYGIVKQHGGSIWVYSEPGRGTTFKVYLPRVLDEAAPKGRAPSHEAPWVGTETILVVEDEPAVLRMAQRSLETRGYRVLAAASPSEAEAVLLLHGAGVALLLTDLMLPERDGHMLFESARAKYPHLRVLYTSGYADHAIVQRGILAPGTAFIQKPFTVEALANKVREVLASRLSPESRGDTKQLLSAKPL